MAKTEIGADTQSNEIAREAARQLAAELGEAADAETVFLEARRLLNHPELEQVFCAEFNRQRGERGFSALDLDGFEMSEEGWNKAIDYSKVEGGALGLWFYGTRLAFDPTAGEYREVET